MDRSMTEILGGVKLYVTLMICLAILTVELPNVSGFRAPRHTARTVAMPPVVKVERGCYSV